MILRASVAELAERCPRNYERELEKRSERLCKVLPDNFEDSMAHLEFATQRARHSTNLRLSPEPIIRMVRHAAASLHSARFKERWTLRYVTTRIP